MADESLFDTAGADDIMLRHANSAQELRSATEAVETAAKVAALEQARSKAARDAVVQSREDEKYLDNKEWEVDRGNFVVNLSSQLSATVDNDDDAYERTLSEMLATNKEAMSDPAVSSVISAFNHRRDTQSKVRLEKTQMDSRLFQMAAEKSGEVGIPPEELNRFKKEDGSFDAGSAFYYIGRTSYEATQATLRKKDLEATYKNDPLVANPHIGRKDLEAAAESRVQALFKAVKQQSLPDIGEDTPEFRKELSNDAAALDRDGFVAKYIRMAKPDLSKTGDSAASLMAMLDKSNSLNGQLSAIRNSAESVWNAYNRLHTIPVIDKKPMTEPKDDKNSRVRNTLNRLR